MNRVPIKLLFSFIKKSITEKKDLSNSKIQYLTSLFSFWSWEYVYYPNFFNKDDLYLLERHYPKWIKNVEYYMNKPTKPETIFKENEWDFLEIPYEEIHHKRPDEQYEDFYSENNWDNLYDFIIKNNCVPTINESFYEYYFKLRYDFFNYLYVHPDSTKLANLLIKIGEIPTNEEWELLEKEWRIKFIKGICNNLGRIITSDDSRVIHNYITNIKYKKGKVKIEKELITWLNDNFNIKKRKRNSKEIIEPCKKTCLEDLYDIAITIENNREASFEQICDIVLWYVQKYSMIPKIYEKWYNEKIITTQVFPKIFWEIIKIKENLPRIFILHDEMKENGTLALEYLKRYGFVPHEIQEWYSMQ